VIIKIQLELVAKCHEYTDGRVEIYEASLLGSRQNLLPMLSPEKQAETQRAAELEHEKEIEAKYLSIRQRKQIRGAA